MVWIDVTRRWITVVTVIALATVACTVQAKRRMGSAIRLSWVEGSYLGMPSAMGLLGVSVTTIITSRNPVPNAQQIVIPPVPPGIYRIRDRAIDADVQGFAFVEVIEP